MEETRKIRMQCLFSESTMKDLKILTDFLEGLKQRGFTISLPEAGIPHPASADLYLTDQPETAEHLAAYGQCVVGLDRSERGLFFPGTSLVLMEPGQSAADDVLDAYQHFSGIPARIGETERLLVRESTENDFETILSMIREADRPGFRNLSFGTSQDTVEMKEKYLAYLKTSYRFFGFGLWSVVLKSSNQVIGWCGLCPVADEISPEGRIEIGYLIEKQQRRKGYAFEACREILKFAFEKLECTEIFAMIDKSNTSSLALASKLGMVRRETEMEDTNISIWYKTSHRKGE